MSIFTRSQGLELKRKTWQQQGKNQHSFSLDTPRKLYDIESLSDPFESLLNTPIRCRDEDRFFLYLPRNLSYCEVCSDVIRDHVQKKVRLLSNRLSQYEDIPPTPVDYFSFEEEDNGEEKGLWTKNGDHNVSLQESTSFKFHPSILKKRAISFPAPRREGKKVVRFADALGLELESIRYLVKKDLHSVVPTASGQPRESSPSTSKKIQLYPAFIAPSLSVKYLCRLKRLKVSLHSVSTADSTVYGIISVVNLSFHKLVFVRYTANGWTSFHDEIALYLDGSSDNGTDKFSFTMFCNPSDLCNRGHSLFFAVCYQTDQQERYWDNNDGKNYCIKCEQREIPPIGNHTWVHFL